MAATTIIKLTTAYADETKRDIEIGPLAPTSAAVTNAKSNIASINANAGEISGLLLSAGGASFVSISAAHVITSERTDLYNPND